MWSCAAKYVILAKINAMQDKITFQFVSEPSDVNFGGNVHGGSVMKWIDQAAYACAATWAEGYCVTVYVGGIRFYKPIHIGSIVKIMARVMYTGKTSVHIAVDVFSRKMDTAKFEKTTHCVIVFVAVDENGNPRPIQQWVPDTEREKHLQQYAIRLMELRKDIETEMNPFLKEYL
jgi:acyl-CoA hydrolase